MKSNPWMAMWEDTAAAWDWTDYLQNVENWSTEGMSLWTEMQDFVQANAAPRLWLEAAVTFAEAWDPVIRGWASAATPEARDAQKKAFRCLEKKHDEIREQMAAQKKEIARLKRSMGQKERTLNKSRQTVVQQRRDLTEKERQIKALESKMKQQAERLLQLEARAKSKPAVRHPGATGTASR